MTYLDTDRPEPAGSATFEPPSAEGVLLDDRVLVPEPPADLHRRGVYGQPLGEGNDVEPVRLQLSLVEAAYLAERGALSLDGTDSTASTVVERGRAVEGERFDRRLAVYEALRERGVVPKTGFKFGADFRTYGGAEDVDSLGHSESLVRVLPPDHVFTPRELALDVRLAAGVRKRTVFALTDGSGDVTWLSASRLTP